MVTSLTTGLSFVAIQYFSPSGNTTVPPLPHSAKASRMFSVSSSSSPLGVTVQVFRPVGEVVLDTPLARLARERVNWEKRRMGRERIFRS